VSLVLILLEGNLSARLATPTNSARKKRSVVLPVSLVVWGSILKLSALHHPTVFVKNAKKVQLLLEALPIALLAPILVNIQQAKAILLAPSLVLEPNLFLIELVLKNALLTHLVSVHLMFVPLAK